MEQLKFKDTRINITQKVLDVLIDANSTEKDYRNAIDDYNELGEMDGIAEIMKWDDSQKQNWFTAIQRVNIIKQQI